jgi:hypothetical protein
MESESPSIDPRYRPEFQRGYRGELRPIVAPPQLPDIPVAAVEGKATIEPVVIGSTEERPTEERTIGEHDPSAALHHWNPWMTAIFIFGIAGMALGGWLVVQQALGAYASQSESDPNRFFQIFSYIFAAPLVTVGLATMVGLIFFRAARHRR